MGRSLPPARARVLNNRARGQPVQYDEWPVPESLREHVQCLWRLRDRGDPSHVHTVWPDGRCELIVHRGDPLRWQLPGGDWQVQSRTLFAAQLRSAIRLGASIHADCIGIRLQPAASVAVAGAQLRALVDRVVDLTELAGFLAEQLWRACGAVADDDVAIAARLTALLEQRLPCVPVDPLASRAVALLDACDGDLRTSSLAAAVGCSVRTLQQRFLAAVGLTLKEYARIGRLQRTLLMLDAPEDDLADISAYGGYADQAHATRELRRLTGLTPARLRHALQQSREGDPTLALAAAFVRGR